MISFGLNYELCYFYWSEVHFIIIIVTILFEAKFLLYIGCQNTKNEITKINKIMLLTNFSGQKSSYVYACGDFLKTSKSELFSLLNFPVGKNPRMCTRAEIFWKRQNFDLSYWWIFQWSKILVCVRVCGFFENAKIRTFRTDEFSSGQKSSYVYACGDFFLFVWFLNIYAGLTIRIQYQPLVLKG